MEKIHTVIVQSNAPPVPRRLFTNPCSCLGDNDACFKCGGWGFIDDIGLNRVSKTNEKLTFDGVWRRKKKRVEPKSVKTQTRVNSSSTIKKTRQYEVTFDFQTALRKLLSESFALPKFEADKNPKSLQGDSSVVIELLSGILRKKSSQTIKRLKKKITSLRVSNATHSYKMKKSTKDYRVADNISKTNTKNTFASEKSRADIALSSSPSSSGNGKRNVERILDASRDYYDAYRENGKFGSHPSHDDYDEEASI